jgi:hypothetical protein
MARRSPQIAQLVQSGSQNALGMMQERRMGELFEIEKEKFGEEREAATAINSVYQGEAEIAKKRGAGAQTLAQLRNLAAQDPAVRKTQAPVIFQALEEATGTPLAENFKQFILSAKPEMAGPVMDRMIRGYAGDPNQTLDNLLPVLTSPLTSAQTIGQISRELGDVAAQEAITGPQASPRRNKFGEVKAARERQIAGLEKVVNQYGHTKAGELAQKKIDQMRGELEKMETIISGQDATAMGVRPGTTLTESGTGNLSVLQGPDDSGDGGSLSGLKPSEINTLIRMVGAEFESEINLQTGEMHFKNRGDGAIVNQRVSDTARLYLDSGGKLTLPEAYQQVRKKVGGGATATGTPAAGKNHFSQYDPPGP